MHCISSPCVVVVVVWQCRGDVEGRRVLAAVVLWKRGTFDVCLFVVVDVDESFSHQPILNLVEFLFSYHAVWSTSSAPSLTS
jgi:hypothetical protein